MNIQNEHLSEEQKEQLQTVLTKFTDVFQTSGSPLGHYSGVKHCIDSGHHRPIRSRPYRHPPHLRQIIRDQIQQMLNDKIISPSTSPWSSSIVLVRKKGSNNFLFCIDFRPINKISDRDNFPLPNILDSLDSLGDSQPHYFSTQYMAYSYWQIGLDTRGSI